MPEDSTISDIELAMATMDQGGLGQAGSITPSEFNTPAGAKQPMDFSIALEFISKLYMSYFKLKLIHWQGEVGYDTRNLHEDTEEAAKIVLKLIDSYIESLMAADILNVPQNQIVPFCDKVLNPAKFFDIISNKAKWEFEHLTAINTAQGELGTMGDIPTDSPDGRYGNVLQYILFAITDEKNFINGSDLHDSVKMALENLFDDTLEDLIHLTYIQTKQ